MEPSFLPSHRLNASVNYNWLQKSIRIYQEPCHSHEQANGLWSWSNGNKDQVQASNGCRYEARVFIWTGLFQINTVKCVSCCDEACCLHDLQFCNYISLPELLEDSTDRGWVSQGTKARYPTENLLFIIIKTSELRTLSFIFPIV